MVSSGHLGNRLWTVPSALLCVLPWSPLAARTVSHTKYVCSLNSVDQMKKVLLIWYYFSMLIPLWKRETRFFLYRWSGEARRQGTSNYHGIDLVHLEYSGISSTRMSSFNYFLRLVWLFSTELYCVYIHLDTYIDNTLQYIYIVTTTDNTRCIVGNWYTLHTRKLADTFSQ